MRLGIGVMARGGVPDAALIVPGEPDAVAASFLDRTAIVRDTVTPANNVSLGSTPDNLFTVTRASTATYIGRDRLLKTAASNELRYTHDPVTGEPLGALVEARAATNNLQRSQEFDNAYWSKSLATISADAAVAPDGTTTMDKLVEDTSTGVHQVASTNMSLAKNGTYCFSTWLRDDGIGQIRLVISAFSGNQVHVEFNLGALTATPFNSGNGSSADGGIIDYGGGLYRLWVSGIPNSVDAGTGINVVIMLRRGGTTYTGDGASGAYIWGAQLEAGSYPSSYSPTVSATVTRAADSLTLATSAFPHDATQGTLLVEAIVDPHGLTQTLIELNDATNNERIGLNIQAANNGSAYVYDGNVSQAFASLGSAVTAGTTVKMAIAWSANDIAMTRDGATPSTDAAATLPTVTRLQLGDRGSGGAGLVGILRRAAYISRRMSNTEIHDWTS